MPLTRDNMSNMSNAGLAPSGEGGAYPAASLPFGDLLTKLPADPVPDAKAEIARTAAAGKPPIGASVLEFDVLMKRSFPDEAWHPSFRAQAVLAEFAATVWPELRESANPIPQTVLGVKSFDDLVEDEIKYLVNLAANRRPARLAEIIAQADDARPYWSDMLLAGPAIRPFTWALVETGLAVGQMVAMHFKALHNRARPAQVYPALMPPILTPPHSSYPNAHALQSLLMSGCAAVVATDLAAPLKALAHRIGENREIAGVHYPSDRKASEHIAEKILGPLQGCPRFVWVRDKAIKEW